MKAVLLLALILVAINCLTTFHFHHGDQLLTAIQEKMGKLMLY